jgi:Mn-dependent DtxR family transcriptional regulator
MHNTQQTSLFAFIDIKPEITGRQKLVYEELQKHENMTNTEISQSLNIPINAITPRIHELRKKGLVNLATTRKCRVTGKNCCAWEVGIIK